MGEFPDHMARLLDECDKLSVKLDKIDKFIQDDIFETLSEHEQALLSWQYGAMQIYHHALSARIGFYTDNDVAKIVT